MCACICQKNVCVKEKMCMHTAVDAASSAKNDYALAESLNLKKKADSTTLTL